jgi:glycolate oxidase iron-sulfur subunit
MHDQPSTPAAMDRRAELDALLRRCVQCGLCLPVCATWLATGDETMSPRGRLILLGDLLAGRTDAGPPDPSVSLALGTCIGCQACTAVCPSGVPAALLEGAVAMGGEPPALRVAAPEALLRRLDQPALLRGIGALAYIGRGLLRMALGSRWRARAGEIGGVAASVARLAGSVPRAPRSDRELVRRLDGLCRGAPTPLASLPRPDAPSERVIWFAGCANEGLLPHSSRRLRALLEWAGAELLQPAGAACCGALASHGGQPARAAVLRDRNLGCWSREGGAGAAAAIVTEAAGCGVAVRGYGASLPAPQVDAIVWLARTRLPGFGPVPLKVALHDPCHARHGQAIIAEPRALLRAVPQLELLEPDEADACCGSGGAWGLRHPGLSADLGERKARLLAATGADLVVTANPGCLGQIADALAALPFPTPPVIPLGDLLWFAALRGCPGGHPTPGH